MALWVSVAAAAVRVGAALSARPAAEPATEGATARDVEDEETSPNLSTGSATVHHKSNIHSLY